jgi:hypothetical protein
MRLRLAALALLMLAAGCDRLEPSSGAAPAPSPPAAPPVPVDRAAIDFVDSDGVPAATLRCAAGSLSIQVPGFRSIASEDRLSIGTDEEAFALVADLAAAGPGVTASGPPDSDLLNRLGRGYPLFASYGRQSVGPLATQSPEGLQAVLSTCRH